jgi:hypothetical protein
MRTHTLLAFLALALSGCHAIHKAGRPMSNVPPPQAPRTSNYFKSPMPDKSLPMRRVAMLPLSGGQVTAEALRDISTAFHAELSKKALFEIVTVSGSELEAMCGRRQLSSVEQLPAQVLESLREKYGADGVLFTDITHLNAYRPISIGVRAKLVDIGSGSISWASDCVYDSGHPATAESARLFQRQFSDPHRTIPDDGGSVLISPARFAKYVASATFNSLDSFPQPLQ